MTASVARLHAGDGYTYLTRQVASGDHQRTRGDALSDYYTADGCPPGRWHGSGLAALGLDGIVSEDQMKALFGEGLHPNAAAIIADRLPLERARLGIDDLPASRRPAAEQSAYAAAEQAARLGRKFPHFDDSRETAWQASLDQAKAQVREDRGLATDAELSREDRGTARMVAGEMLFTREHNRAPATAAELEAYVVQRSRPTPQPVSGYDVTFTPVKSVSVLWGVGDDHTRRAIEDAHREAVDTALAYIEAEVLFTRTGAGGVAQQSVGGLIAARFDHFDSRTGDPNLHTHVAIPNRVQGPDGKWRSIDGRVIFAANVSYSEVYNTALEEGVVSRLGVAFADRDMGEGKRPVREIDGLDPRLASAFATRRGAIERAYADLARDYRNTHGKEPNRAVRLDLAQRATLETRHAKGPVESLATKRERWHRIAAEVVGEAAVEGLLARAQEHATPSLGSALVDQQGRFVGVEQAAQAVVDRVAQDRATWRLWHVRAEAHRQLRGVPGLTPTERERVIEDVTQAALAASVLCEAPEPEEAPAELTRPNGEMVFRQHGGQRYTSWAVLAAEGRLVDAARTPVPAPLDLTGLEETLQRRRTQATASGGHPLSAAQEELVRVFGAADRQLVVGIGPAGAGKTAALRALVQAAERQGHSVIGMAPSAAAAKVFAEETGAAKSSTVDLALVRATHVGDDASGIEAGDIVVVDEAGMAGTAALAQLNALCERRGAVLRLIGDDQQLSAVGAGGALRVIAHEVGAVRLTELHRFHDPAEAANSLLVRDGDHAAIAFYEDTDRLHTGTREALVEQLYDDWLTDRAEGRNCVMIAVDNATVHELSERARADLVAAGSVEENGVQLRTGAQAGVGDIVVTRRNDRTLKAGQTDFVKNGDLWAVRKRHDDGSLTVKNQRHHATATLPASYVHEHVELGYATTVHRAQGLTVDVARSLVDPASTTREQFYVAATRGRAENHAYAITDSMEALHADHQPAPVTTGREVLSQVLDRVDEGSRSASETIEVSFAEASSLARLVPEYEHALGLAHAQRIDRAVDEIFGRERIGAEQLREDPAYGALRARLAALHEAGHDPAEVLSRVVERRELATAHSPAATVAWRLDQVYPASPRGETQAGAKGPQTQNAATNSSPGLAHWLEAQQGRIANRERELTRALTAQPPPWAAPLVDQGVDRSTLGAIARYRDRYGVHDSSDALGHEPAQRSRQHREWKDLTAHVEDRHQAAPPDQGSAADRLRAALDRSRSEGTPVSGAADRLRQIAQGKPPAAPTHADAPEHPNDPTERQPGLDR